MACELYKVIKEGALPWGLGGLLAARELKPPPERQMVPKRSLRKSEVMIPLSMASSLDVSAAEPCHSSVISGTAHCQHSTAAASEDPWGFLEDSHGPVDALMESKYVPIDASPLNAQVSEGFGMIKLTSACRI